MPIVKPRLNAKSLNGAVSSAFTRSGPDPLFVPGNQVGSGAGVLASDTWIYNGRHFSPQPGHMQVDGFMGRLDRVQRVYLSNVDAAGNDVSFNLADVSDQQGIDIGGVQGQIAALSYWHWPRTEPWRSSNVYLTVVLLEPIALPLLEDKMPYLVEFV